MARGINKVILVGTLGKDPETKYTQGGTCVASFSMATNENWKDKQTGQMQERTEWHRVSMFGRLAEIAGEYLKKGSQVYIEGKLQTRKWQDQSGQDRYTTEIVANEMQMLGGNDQASNQGQQGNRPQQQGGYQNQQQNNQGGHQQPRQNQGPQPAVDDFSDDIPF